MLPTGSTARPRIRGEPSPPTVLENNSWDPSGLNLETSPIRFVGANARPGVVIPVLTIGQCPGPLLVWYGQLLATYALPAASTVSRDGLASPMVTEYRRVEPSALSLTMVPDVVFCGS